MRSISNCLVVALNLWIASRGRGGIGCVRSTGMWGLIPHFLHWRERKRGGEMLLIDAIPPRRKDAPWQRGDTFVMFPVTYRVRRYRLVATGTADTLKDAIRSMWGRGGDDEVAR